MKDTLGLIFTYKHEEGLSQLTQKRSISSIPFGGRYRVIDFLLSAMVNSNISKVGLLTKENYSSLMAHIGSGKEWDLSRKREGLYFIPPFSNSNNGSSTYRGRMDALANAYFFLDHSTQEYVLCGDADSIFNGTFDEMMDYHLEKQADITLLYKGGDFVNEPFNTFCFLQLAEDGRVTDVAINPAVNRTSLCVGTFLIRRTLLLELIRDCQSHNEFSFRNHVLLKHLSDLRIYGYRYTSYMKVLTTVASYYDASMDLLKDPIRAELFDGENGIFTRIRDQVPTVYRNHPTVKNSLIADGCVIEGDVENSILFRGVHIEKGARVSNSIIMQGTMIMRDAELHDVIIDKNVVVHENRKLYGFDQFPIVLPKGADV